MKNIHQREQRLHALSSVCVWLIWIWICAIFNNAFMCDCCSFCWGPCLNLKRVAKEHVSVFCNQSVSELLAAYLFAAAAADSRSLTLSSVLLCVAAFRRATALWRLSLDRKSCCCCFFGRQINLDNFGHFLRVLKRKGARKESELTYHHHSLTG